MEIMEAMGDTSVGVDTVPKCGYCGKRNHDEPNCFKKQRDQGLPSGRKSSGGCAICGDKEHWKNECPDRDTCKDKKSQKQSNITKSQSKMSGDLASNSLRPLDCTRCKFASKLTSCAGCKKTSNINHCLLHCPTYNALSVEDKTTLVKSTKICAIYLHPSQTSVTTEISQRITVA